MADSHQSAHAAPRRVRVAAKRWGGVLAAGFAVFAPEAIAQQSRNPAFERPPARIPSRDDYGDEDYAAQTHWAVSTTASGFFPGSNSDNDFYGDARIERLHRNQRAGLSFNFASGNTFFNRRINNAERQTFAGSLFWGVTLANRLDFETAADFGRTNFNAVNRSPATGGRLSNIDLRGSVYGVSASLALQFGAVDRLAFSPFANGEWSALRSAGEIPIGAGPSPASFEPLDSAGLDGRAGGKLSHRFGAGGGVLVSASGAAAFAQSGADPRLPIGIGGRALHSPVTLGEGDKAWAEYGASASFGTGPGTSASLQFLRSAGRENGNFTAFGLTFGINLR